MQQFYEELSALRKKQGIDLAEIHNRTKINIQFLEAIEAGQFDILPKPYIRLFLRAYIKEVGGNPEEILDKFELHFTGRKPEKQEKTPVKKSTEKTENISKPILPKSQINIRSNVIKGTVLLLIWIFALVVVRKITMGPTEVTKDGTVLNAGIEIITEDQLLNYVVASTNDLAFNESTPYNIKIVSSEPVGFLVGKDSDVMTPISLPVGNQKVYHVESQIEILFRHTNGVKLFINNDKLEEFNRSDEPVRINISSNPPLISIKTYVLNTP